MAAKLDAGRVVGLFFGRIEFGPRSPGGRSILGDSRNPDMQTRLNPKIEYRESFRPFGPTVLADRVGDCLVDRRTFDDGDMLKQPAGSYQRPDDGIHVVDALPALKRGCRRGRRTRRFPIDTCFSPVGRVLDTATTTNAGAK